MIWKLMILRQRVMGYFIRKNGNNRTIELIQCGVFSKLCRINSESCITYNVSLKTLL